MLGVIGDLVEDIVVWQHDVLRPGTDTPATVHRARGGSAANVAAQAAELYPTRFIGCVGDDSVGRNVTATLAHEGVDVRVQVGSRTGSIVVLVSPDGERTMLPDRGASAELSTIDPDWLAELDAVHVTGYSLVGEPALSACRQALAVVRGAGGLVSLDVSSSGIVRDHGTEDFHILLAELAPDVIFANDDEADLLGWRKNTRANQLVVIKQGPAPVIVLTPQGSLRVAVPRVDGVRDTTGAGDAFAAGFLTALLAQSCSEQIRAVELAKRAGSRHDLLVGWCEAGHARAAQVITRPGAGAALL